MLAVDFFTVETIWLQRLYVLFFIELGSRRIHVAGCRPNPSAPWVTQQARQLTWALAERPEPFRFLIHDRDQKFTDSVDEVFRSDDIEIIRTPFRAIYARVSTLEQEPENQLADLRAYTVSCGWTITTEYVDRGVSGAKGHSIAS